MPRTRIKICGITRDEDADLAARLGADALGFNFHPQSPRYVSLERAKALSRHLPPLVEPVALFVQPTIDQVRAMLQGWPHLRTVQMHGLADKPFPDVGVNWIPAFPVAGLECLANITRFLEACFAADHLPGAILVDASVPGLHGGTGKTAPWDLLADFQPGVPMILAGGLTPDNVAAAIRQVKPYAVDVASGVERTPGIKDAEKMQRFVGEVLSAG
jgi:phosphoribosylanthranilate isomerase